MLRRFSINFALLSIFIDMLIIVGSLALAATLRQYLNGVWFLKTIPTDVGIPWVLYLVFPLLTIFIFAAFSLYDGKKLLKVVDEFSSLSFAFLILLVSSAGILYLSFRDVSRALFLLFILIAFVGLLIWRVLARVFFRLRKEYLNSASRRILLVGAGPLAQKVCESITSHAVENLCMVGYMDDDGQAGIRGVDMLGKVDHIRIIIDEQVVTDVVLALPHSAYNNLARIVSLIQDAPVRIWVALGFSDLALYRTDITDVAGIPMLDLRASALSEYQLQIKRAFDLILGSLLTIAALPFMLISAVMIWLQDHGPIIFKQNRVGENGRLFTIYKFRTMVPDAERRTGAVSLQDEGGNLTHKARNDPRVTTVGRFLRRFSIDELPQLFNVLQGTMSLVGPRPELPYLVEKYQPWQRKRFTVPPGITGWWQVNGRSDKPLHLNTEDDLYYIQNYSILLDLVILMRTAWAVVIGKGSF